MATAAALHDRPTASMLGTAPGQPGTSLFCRHGAVDPSEGGEAQRPELPPIEEEANNFAAALLMPADMVRREYRRTGGDFDALRSVFSSSGAAMGRRLHQTV